jgi:hypothetical protein
MTYHTTIRSWPAMALGGIFALGTTAVILDDVRQGAEFTTDHVMTVLVILGTIAAGHMFWPAIKTLRLMSAVGLALVFVGGTYFCVSGSAGRSAKVLMHREAEATKVLDARKDVENELKKAREARAALSATYAKECAGGLGPRCKGLKEALATADDQVRLYEVRFDGLKPSEQANGELRYTAELVALIVKAPVQEIEKAIGLITPLAKALILELATIVFFGLGFGHTKVSKISTPPPSGELKSLPAPKQEVVIVDPVVEALRKAKRPVTNDELADLLSVSKAQASKLVSARDGMLRRERVGRTVAISLAHH